MHIETSLVDGTYEFIREPDEDFSEAQTNVELTEAPNSDSKELKTTNSDSKELKTTNSVDINTGKPRCIILLFYTTYYFFVHLSYWS